MLKEAMRAYRVTDPEFAQQFADLLEAAYLDLKIAGVVIEGEVSITVTETENQRPGETEITVTDNSTIEDKLVIRAMQTYIGANATFLERTDKESYAASYDLQRKQLANATGYTNFGEGTGEE